jgi:hypothetical protein
MRPPGARIFLLLYAAGILLWADVFAQGHEDHSHAVHASFQLIEEAEATGVITKDEAIIQKLAAGLDSDILSQQFRSEGVPAVKCMTPVLLEYYEMQDELQPQTKFTAERLIRNISSSLEPLEYVSPSGRFKFTYETDGSNAVPLDDTDGNSVPDYVEKAAVMADSSYRYQVETLGFPDFLEEEPYEISFRRIGAYGFTQQSGATTKIVVHNTFSGFPENSHPEGDQTGALYATIAHEIKHAIQFVTNRWQADAGRFDWIEMDATMMEEIVHPDVNDYYNYIKADFEEFRPHRNSIFGVPQNATPGAYWHVSWMLYFQEQFGMDFWVEVWDEIYSDFRRAGSEDDKITFFNAISLVLQERGAKLEQEHLSNHLWHLASGPFLSPIDYGFEDRENYPEPFMNHSLAFLPDSVNSEFLLPMAANYIDVQPTSAILGQPAVSVSGNTDGLGVGIIGYFRDGTTDVRLSVSPDQAIQSIQTTWDWADLTDLKVVVVNTNREQAVTYDLSVSSIVPDGDAITQNYPNPFNPTTQIGFSVDNRKDVKLEVYDTAGRKVQTLIDRELNRGFYTATFDGTGLASGIYFYRLVTGNSVLTKKMVLVK